MRIFGIRSEVLPFLCVCNCVFLPFYKFPFSSGHMWYDISSWARSSISGEGSSWGLVGVHLDIYASGPFGTFVVELACTPAFWSACRFPDKFLSVPGGTSLLSILWALLWGPETNRKRKTWSTSSQTIKYEILSYLLASLLGNTLTFRSPVSLLFPSSQGILWRSSSLIFLFIWTFPQFFIGFGSPSSWSFSSENLP